MFTFKKIISAFFVFLLFVVCLSACTFEEHGLYETLVLDGYNNMYYRGTEVEYWQGVSDIRKDVADRSCTFLGKDYYGSYSRSYCYDPNSYTIDEYTTDDGTTFGFRQDTGEFVHYGALHLNIAQDAEPDVEDPYENAVSLATNLAGEFVDDLEEYTDIEIKQWVPYGSVTNYGVYFTKKFEGYLSSDYIHVVVNSKGTLVSLSLGDINAFDGVKFNFNEKAVKQSIVTKTEAFYKDSILTVNDIAIDGNDQTIVLTPDGKVCLYSKVDIKGVDTRSGLEASTSIWVLTTIAKK